MARTRTLGQLRDEARACAAMEASEFVSDDEINRWINLSIPRLYDLLVAARGDAYYKTQATLATVAGVATVALPTTFYKLLGLDVSIAGDVVHPQPLEWARRGEFATVAGWSYGGDVYYDLEPGVLRFYPTPFAVHSLTCWYIPHATELASSESSFDGINGWERWVVVDVAIQLLQKEESDVQVLMMEREKLEAQIRRMAPSRDRTTERVRDVRARSRLSGWDPR